MEQGQRKRVPAALQEGGKEWKFVPSSQKAWPSKEATKRSGPVSPREVLCASVCAEGAAIAEMG